MDDEMVLGVAGFFFNDTATTEIYTLSLHDALPIYRRWRVEGLRGAVRRLGRRRPHGRVPRHGRRGQRVGGREQDAQDHDRGEDRKSTRLNSSHANISYAVFCLTKKNYQIRLPSDYT